MEKYLENKQTTRNGLSKKAYDKETSGCKWLTIYVNRP